MVIRLLRAKLWSAPSCRTKIPHRFCAPAQTFSSQDHLNSRPPQLKMLEPRCLNQDARAGSVDEICSISPERESRSKGVAGGHERLSVIFRWAARPRIPLDAILEGKPRFPVDLSAD